MKKPNVNPFLLFGAPLLFAACIKPSTIPPNSSQIECVIVQAGCCDCNASGSQIALPATQAQEHLDALAVKCEDIACAQMISDDPSCKAKSAVYQNGKCELVM